MEVISEVYNKLDDIIQKILLNESDRSYGIYFMLCKLNYTITTHILSIGNDLDDNGIRKNRKYRIRLDKITKRLPIIEQNLVNKTYGKQVLKDVNRWFKHAMGIVKNQDKDAVLTPFQNEFSVIITIIVKYYFHNESLYEELTAEKYKPSRVQYIIDNFGIDSIDSY